MKTNPLTLLLALWGILILHMLEPTTRADESLIYHNGFDEPVAGLKISKGKIGGAAVFNGIDDFISIGDLGKRSKLTIALWLNPGDQVDDGDDYNGLVSSNGWEKGVMHFCYLAGRAQCFVHLGSRNRAHVASQVLPRGNWSHIVLVANIMEDRLSIFANGRKSVSTSGIRALGQIQLMQQVIGAEHAGTHKRYFKGAVDEVRIYDRVLSDKEIASLCPGAPLIPNPKPIASSPALSTGVPVVPNEAVFPVYHYKAASGSWFGDINGPLYHDNWFHAFFQWRMPANPKMCWGHARSRDLIHWEHLPVAIAPRGSSGSWSGATTVTTAGPRILFTSDYQQSGATGNDDLIHWTPMKNEPAMPRSLHESKGIKIGGWRDPFVWKHNGIYYSCVGGSSEGKGYISLYKANSEEFDDWEFIGPLFIHPDSPDNACPNFFKIGDKWVLLMSRHRPHVEDWFVGTWNPDTLRFEPETSGILSYNEATYATAGLYHPDGRVIYWNTMHQWRRANKPLDWPGCLSLPRELSIARDNTLQVKPLRELSQLRREHFHRENIMVSDTNQVIEGIKGDALEIKLTMESLGADAFGIVLRRSPDGSRGMEIRYRDTVYIDGEKSMFSLKHGEASDPVRKPFTLRPDEPLRLTIFIDKICFEAFVNDRICYDRIIHTCDHTGKALGLPTSEDLGIGLFAEGGNAVVKSMDVWKMEAIKKKAYPQ